MEKTQLLIILSSRNRAIGKKMPLTKDGRKANDTSRCLHLPEGMLLCTIRSDNSPLIVRNVRADSPTLSIRRSEFPNVIL